MNILRHITMKAWQLHSEQEHQARAERQIKAFARGHKHFRRVRVHMGQLIAAGKAHDLNEAYRLAVRAAKK